MKFKTSQWFATATIQRGTEILQMKRNCPIMRFFLFFPVLKDSGYDTYVRIWKVIHIVFFVFRFARPRRQAASF